MLNRKIFILYTGGTIGMTKSADGYVPQHGFLESKLREMTKSMRNVSPYDIEEYSPLLDSSNMKPKDWVQIGLDIAKRYDQYDAFIVIHGTDTMSYTASALSFMFENLGKPVIMTGSMISLEEPRNDGRNNLITSLILASKYKIPEVVLCFGNRILRGNRSTKTDANGIQAFSSPNYPLLGRAGVTIRLKDNLIMDYPKAPFKFLYIDPRAKVIVVKLFPGINARYLASLVEGSNIHGIVLETFGIGDSPTNKGFIDFIHHLVNRGIIVVNVSQCLKHDVDESDYATGVALRDVGVISGKDMTTEAALAKVYWLLTNVENPSMDEMRQLITMPMRGEL